MKKNKKTFKVFQSCTSNVISMILGTLTNIYFLEQLLFPRFTHFFSFFTLCIVKNLLVAKSKIITLGKFSV